ncbi:MAG TPA: PilZ domain-containing protein [Nitrospiraceae bacterium]|nr:PilZ domain-containing protein [Nitrospiraceae bacterium]
MERRASPRFRVLFRSTFSAGSQLEGEGTVLDISLGGCKVHSTTRVSVDSSLELRIFVPGLDWPLIVDSAAVRWAEAPAFGLAFLRVRDTEQERLRQILAEVRGKPDG